MHLEAWGWSEDFAASWDGRARNGKLGRVISESRGICVIAGEAGELTLAVQGESPVTGDWIVYEPESGRMLETLPRRTKIARKKAGRAFEEQALAANVDVVFVVAGLDLDFNLRRLERYLLAARAGGAAPVVVLNKCDLCEDAAERARQVDGITGGAVPVALVNALERGSVMQLHRYIEPGQTAVLLGSSGAGKSTIVNALLESEVQATGAVRMDDSHGRHTTTARRLFRVDAGWLLIDTPGLGELEPWAPVAAVGEVFEDVAELAERCRFRDCRHETEPGCAVRAAAEAGTLATDRLESYRKLRAELQYLESMQDVRAMLERKRYWKRISKAIRNES